MNKILHVYRILLVICILSVTSASAQNGCFEIESILVNSCGPGGVNQQEGLSEMIRFRLGNQTLNTADFVISWANTNLPFGGLIQNATTAQKTAEFNATITSCGNLREPVNGVLPAHSQVLLISSYNVSTATNFFEFLSDSLIVLYANENTASGHFLNYVPNANPNQQTTLIFFNGVPYCNDQVSYNRTSLVTSTGAIGDEDGATVNFSVDGVPTYVNNGCVAPTNQLSASFSIPGLCSDATSVDVNQYVTGTSGGTWSGQGVTPEGIFNPSSVSGNVDLTYTVGSGLCETTETQTVQIFSNISADWNSPGAYCGYNGALDLNQFITGNTGGTWSGPSVSGNIFNPYTSSGEVSITYTVGSAGCSASQTNIIDVVQLNTIFTHPSTVCSSDAPIDLSAWSAGLDPGEFTGEGVNNNVWDPAGLSGFVAITYTATVGACSIGYTDYITVSPGPDASWTNPGFVCGADGPLNLASLLTGLGGGTWSGLGVSGSTFDPTGIVGNVDITYTLSGSGNCTAIETQTISTGDVPELVITGAGAYCAGETPAPLQTTAFQGAIVTWYDDAAQSNLLFTGPNYTPPADVNATYFAFQSIGQCSSALSSVDVVYNFIPQVPVTETNVEYCEGAALPTLSATSDGSLQWYADQALTNLLASGASYQLTANTSELYVVATNNGCQSASVAIQLEVKPLVTAQIQSSGTSICNGSSVTLSAQVSDPGQWSTGVTSDESIEVTAAGTYSLSVSGACNTATDQVTISDFSSDANFEVSAEFGEAPLAVSIQPQSSASYCDFSIDNLPITPGANGTITFTAAGTFVLTHTCDNNGCINTAQRTIVVEEGNFMLEIPNSFTPNGDGFNDFFKPTIASGILEFSTVIFNRWGQKVAEWEGSTNAWDGSHTGKESPDGVYFYVITGKDVQNQTFERKGSVTMIRN